MTYIVCKPTSRAAKIGLAKPTINADEPMNATIHDAGKPTPNVALIIGPTSKDFMHSIHKPRDAILHDVGKPTSIAATPT